jgi:S1-C subfamily serine protease
MEIGSSKDVEVGQWVLAIGNPLGFDNTVSVGVVSSLKRNLPVGGQGLVDAIQTDAAINQGNSGGALCNSQGQLIGINSAIASSNGGNIGIGFAIPVDRVKSVVSDIVKFGYAKYGGIGVTYRPEFEGQLSYPQFRAGLAEQVGAQDVPNHGIVVMDSTGAAAQAGLKKFDVILAVDDQLIEGTFDLNKVLIPKKPGDTVSVKYWSKGKTYTKNIVLQEVHQA